MSEPGLSAGMITKVLLRQKTRSRGMQIGMADRKKPWSFKKKTVPVPVAPT